MAASHWDLPSVAPSFSGTRGPMSLPVASFEIDLDFRGRKSESSFTFVPSRKVHADADDLVFLDRAHRDPAAGRGGAGESRRPRVPRQHVYDELSARSVRRRR